jgi:hypothetical protein
LGRLGVPEFPERGRPEFTEPTIRTQDGAAITTVLPNVPFLLPATPALTAQMRLGNATDLAKTGARSEIPRASNSFLEQLPVPELGTMELMVTGILALAGAGSLRISKQPGHPLHRLKNGDRDRICFRLILGCRTVYLLSKSARFHHPPPKA